MLKTVIYAYVCHNCCIHGLCVLQLVEIEKDRNRCVKMEEKVADFSLPCES